MASSSSHTSRYITSTSTSRSGSPSLRAMTATATTVTPTPTSMSRVAEAVQVAPYLTHVVRHHGQVTLIPPENSGRIRKGKVKKKQQQQQQRPSVARVENSSSSLNDLSAIVAGPSTSSRSRSRPQTPRPRPASSNSFRSLSSRTDESSRPGSDVNGVNGAHVRSRSYQDDLCIPDFPPPSFEEAMLATPSPRNSTPGLMVERPPSAERTGTPSSVRDIPREQPPHQVEAPTSQEISPPSPEIEPPSPSSSHSSLEETAERGRQSIWEDDRAAGYSLEERVKRELERRKLAESLPTAPLMWIFEQSNGHANQAAVPEPSRTDDCTLKEEVVPSGPSSQDVVAPSRDLQEGRDPPLAPASVPSTSSYDVRNEGQSPSNVAEESSSQRISSRKGKEREVVPDEPVIGNERADSPPSKPSQGSTLSRIRDVLNSPLRPPPRDSNPRTDSVSPSSQISLIHVEGEPPDRPTSPQRVSTPPIISNHKDDLSNIHVVTNPALISPFHSDISSHISITPSSLSSSTSPSDSLGSQPLHTSRPLPIPPGPPPSISVPPPLPTRRAPPPIPRPGTSVRERVSAFESLTNRPVPPPPPLRTVIRRPPPPVPGSSNIPSVRDGVAIQMRQQQDSISAESDDMNVADRQKVVNAPCLSHRQRPPPPVPPRRRKEEDNVKPNETTSSLAPEGQSSDTQVEMGIPSSSLTSRPESTDATSNALEATDLVPERDMHDQNDRLLGLTTLITAVNEAAPLEDGDVPTDIPSSLSDTRTNLASESQTEAFPLDDIRSENQSQINIRENNGEFRDSSFNLLQDNGTISAAIGSVDGAGHSPSPSATESQGDPHTSTRTVETIDDVVGGEILHASNRVTENPPSVEVEHQLPLDINLASAEVRDVESASTGRAEGSPSIIPPMQPLQPMFTGLTDLDLLLARLDDPDFTFSGRSYDDLLLLEDIMGPATATGQLTHPHTDFDDIPMGKVEVLRRRVTKDGRTKLKLALLGVVVDKCGICLVQFKEGVFACLLPCRHAFHDNCLRLWMRRGETCPLCRGSLCYS